jgi:hypothetical protein
VSMSNSWPLMRNEPHSCRLLGDHANQHILYVRFVYPLVCMRTPSLHTALQAAAACVAHGRCMA